MIKRGRLFLLTICISIFFLNNAFPQEEKEIIQFAKILERSIIMQDKMSFNRLFDYNQFFKNIIPQEFDNEEFREFNQEFIKALEPNFNMADMMFQSINSEKKFFILNYFRYDKLTDNQYGIWFRLFEPPRGLNYFKFEVIKENESFKIKDIYAIKAGEYISESLKIYY